MASPFSIVRSGYDAIGVRYRDWSSGSTVRLDWVARLELELAPGGVVLDLGCGPGDPVTRLLAHRHRVIGVDASAVQLRLAQQAAPGALLVQADMTRLAIRPATVDVVASLYALGHVPSERHAEFLMDVAGWLRPGGCLLTNAPMTAGDDEDADWLGVRMFFGGIGEAATRRALMDADLDVVEWQVVPEDEGDGKIVRFLWILARKPR